MTRFKKSDASHYVALFRSTMSTLSSRQSGHVVAQLCSCAQISGYSSAFSVSSAFLSFSLCFFVFIADVLCFVFLRSWPLLFRFRSPCRHPKEMSCIFARRWVPLAVLMLNSAYVFYPFVEYFISLAPVQRESEDEHHLVLKMQATLTCRSKAS